MGEGSGRTGLIENGFVFAHEHDRYPRGDASEHLVLRIRMSPRPRKRQSGLLAAFHQFSLSFLRRCDAEHCATTRLTFPIVCEGAKRGIFLLR